MVRLSGNYELKNELYGSVSFTQLVRDVSHRTGYTINETNEFITCVFDSIKQSLYDRYTVVIPNFGRFTLQKNMGRMYYNLKKTNMLYSSPHYRPKFYYTGVFIKQIKKKVKINRGKEIERLNDQERQEFPLREVEEYLECTQESTQD
jgi:nucleoid DNA-binding protein